MPVIIIMTVVFLEACVFTAIWLRRHKENLLATIFVILGVASAVLSAPSWSCSFGVSIGIQVLFCGVPLLVFWSTVPFLKIGKKEGDGKC